MRVRLQVVKIIYAEANEGKKASHSEYSSFVHNPSKQVQNNYKNRN